MYNLQVCREIKRNSQNMCNPKKARKKHGEGEKNDQK